MNDVFACPVGRDHLANELRRPAFAPVLAYGAAAVASGLIVGAAVGFAGGLVRGSLPAWAWDGAVIVLALVLAFAVVLQMAGRIYPLPQRQAQVPRRWTRWNSKVRTAIAFGAMLGGGVFTYIHHASAYVLGCALFLSYSPTVGGAAGALYGVVRAATLGLAWWRRENGPAMTRRALRQEDAATLALPWVATACASIAFLDAMSASLN